jgi:tetratricopeptide (TPR) repeat protein
MPEKTEAEKAFDAGRQAYSLQAPRLLFESRDWFRKAIELEPTMWRAHSLLAYTLVQAWLQGWSGDDALAEAGEESEQAWTALPGDPYTNAERGFFLLNTGDYDGALTRYRFAAELENASNEVKCDCAEAEIYAGELDAGFDRLQAVVNSNPKPKDWHRWNLAWAWFLKGRQFAAGDQEALDELNRIETSPRSPNYHVDCLLLRAVVETRLDRGGDATADLEWFLSRRTDWTLWREQSSVKFKLSEDRAHWLDGCKAAGLPK